LATGPSFPPDVEDPGSRHSRLDLFLKFIRRHLYSACTFVALFALIFAGAVSCLPRPERLEAGARRNVGVVLQAIASPLPEFRDVVGIFEPNQTITRALAKQGLSGDTVNRIIDSAKEVHNLAKVQAGRHYWISFERDGDFRNFRYPVDDERYLTVYHEKGHDHLVAVMKNFSYETLVEPVSAEIEGSLFASILNIGEKEQVALELSDIFGSDIDFYSDIQRGDAFKVLIEKKYLNGRFVKYGAIQAAAFRNKQKLLTGFRFEDENGKPVYYTAEGKSLKKSFLKSPLKFSRITSRFSISRMHPVLKMLRPHMGVDYAAQVGTPVQAVASGVVKSAGYSGGSGNMVRIHHAGALETMYLHLSRIAVRAGARVSQGQVIGYVGSTGLSTGPHLDFRIQQHGRSVNPLKMIFPPGPPVSPGRFSDFAILRDKWNKELQMVDLSMRSLP
jgi:murein DD-endopeptidase MepM/ murein hydrolase activator NlpD